MLEFYTCFLFVAHQSCSTDGKYLHSCDTASSTWSQCQEIPLPGASAWKCHNLEVERLLQCFIVNRELREQRETHLLLLRLPTQPAEAAVGGHQQARTNLPP